MGQRRPPTLAWRRRPAMLNARLRHAAPMRALALVVLVAGGLSGCIAEPSPNPDGDGPAGLQSFREETWNFTMHHRREICGDAVCSTSLPDAPYFELQANETLRSFDIVLEGDPGREA